MMRHCQHNWSGVLDCTKCGAEKGIGELQAEIERLNAETENAKAAYRQAVTQRDSKQAEIERLNARLRVLQESATNVGPDVWVMPLTLKETVALYGEAES